MSIYQGPHCTGKTGKMAPKNPCQGKHREFGKFAQTEGVWFAQAVNSLILKVKDISICAAQISYFFFNWIRLASQFCVCNNQKQAKVVVRQGKNRENTGNLKMQFEWVP